MKCFGFDARAFHHTAAGASGRRCQHDFAFREEMLEHFDNCPQDGGFTGSGRAGHDGQVMPERHIHGFALSLRQRYSHAAADMCQCRNYIEMLRRFGNEPCNLSCRFILPSEAGKQIDISAAADDFSLKNHVFQDIFNFSGGYAHLRERQFIVE